MSHLTPVQARQFQALQAVTLFRVLLARRKVAPPAMGAYFDEAIDLLKQFGFGVGVATAALQLNVSSPTVRHLVRRGFLDALDAKPLQISAFSLAQLLLATHSGARRLP
jgi:hypothetical protein